MEIVYVPNRRIFENSPRLYPSDARAFLEANGTQGWAPAFWFNIFGNFNNLPVISNSTIPSRTTPSTVVDTARPIYNVVIRSCPSTSCTQINLVPWQSPVDVFGHSTNGEWINMRYSDSTGNIVIGWTYKLYYRANNDLGHPLPKLPVVQ
jgi:hypothetical protein